MKWTITLGAFGLAAAAALSGCSDNSGLGQSLDPSSVDCDEPEAATVTIVQPTSQCDNPCTFRVNASEGVTQIRYIADDQWEFADSSDAAGQFEASHTFSSTGVRKIAAVGYDDNNVELGRHEVQIAVGEAGGNGSGSVPGAWLWYIQGTGMTHEQLAQQLASTGFKRVYIKLADDVASCDSWPEMCDASVPATYAKYGVEPWAWSYNYPGDEYGQADALYYAAKSGYKGYVLDIEIEFDGATQALHDLLSEFRAAWDDAKSAGFLDIGWPIYATTWGNPMDHGMRVDIIDQYVDGHMPQTYVEVWGQSYMADAAQWVHAGTCEYRAMGANKPVHHIVSTEYGTITPSQLQAFLKASGPETSVWRVPGNGTPTSIWNDWQATDWSRTEFNLASCP